MKQLIHYFWHGKMFTGAQYVGGMALVFGTTACILKSAQLFGSKEPTTSQLIAYAVILGISLVLHFVAFRKASSND